MFTTVTALNLTTMMLVGTVSTNVEQRSVETFDAVEITGQIDLTVTRSPEQGPLVISAADESRACVDTHVSEGVLYIEARGCPEDAGRIAVTVSMPALKSLQLRGSGDADINTRTDELRLVIHPSSGDVRLAGAVRRLATKTYGASDIDAVDLAVVDANVEIFGSGETLLSVAQSLAARVFGTGEVSYAGTPQVHAQTFGAGRVERVDMLSKRCQQQKGAGTDKDS